MPQNTDFRPSLIPLAVQKEISHAVTSTEYIPREPAVLPEELDEIELLLRRLKKGSELRTMGQGLLRFLRNEPNASPKIDKACLIHVLSQPTMHWRKRKAAAWMLGVGESTKDWKPNGLPTLRSTLESKRQNSDYAFLRAVGQTLLLSCILIVAFSSALFRIPLEQIAGALVWSLFFAVPLGFGVVPLSMTNDKTQQDEVRGVCALTLARLSGKDSIDSLARVLRSGGKPRASAARALKAVLPLLTAEDYGRLPSDVVPNLCAALRRQDMRWIAEEILEALEKIGDGRAVRSVAEVAGLKAWPELHATAERILPILQERQRQENEKAMLLRGSAQPTAPEQLLRPAHADTQTPPQVLLRSSEAPPAARG